MQSQPFQACQQCLILLAEPQQSFSKVQFLKRLARISSNQKYRKTSLFLYCLYCIIHKFDYVEALEAIQKSQGVDEGSMMSIGLCRLIRGLLYTYIDKHRDALILLKQAVQLMKSVDPISLEMKNHYKRMIPVVVSNLNMSNGKKSFYKFFNQIYDQLAKQTNTNEINEEILYSIHFGIQSLKQQINHLPTLTYTNASNKKTFPKPLNQNRLNSQSKDLPQQDDDDYMGFAKPLTKQQKSVSNIKKMIENQKLIKQTTKKSQSKGSFAFNTKNTKKTLLKNQPNPYQMNLYADEKPECEFL